MSTYNKTVWQDGDIITADKMNNIENGIYSYNEDITNLDNIINDTVGIKITSDSATSHSNLGTSNHIVSISTVEGYTFGSAGYASGKNLFECKGKAAQTNNGVTITPLPNNAFLVNGECTSSASDAYLGTFVYIPSNSADVPVFGELLVIKVWTTVPFRAYYRAKKSSGSYELRDTTVSTTGSMQTVTIPASKTVPADVVGVEIAFRTGAGKSYSNDLIWVGVFHEGTEFFDLDAVPTVFQTNLPSICTLYYPSVVEHMANTKDYVDNHLPADMVTESDLIYISPEMYGAVGDGVTDDSAALQACVNMAASNKRLVVRGYGSYKIVTTLTINGSYLNVFIHRIIYSGSDVAIVLQGKFNIIDFDLIDAETGTNAACIRCLNSWTSSKVSCRYMISKGNNLELIRESNAEGNLYYNQFYFQRNYTYNGHVILADINGSGGPAENDIYGKDVKAPNGYLMYFTDPTKSSTTTRLHQFSLEGSIQSGVYGNLSLVGLRFVECMDLKHSIDSDAGTIIKIVGVAPQAIIDSTSQFIDYCAVDVRNALSYEDALAQVKQNFDDGLGDTLGLVPLQYANGTSVKIGRCNRIATHNISGGTQRFSSVGDLYAYFNHKAFKPDKDWYHLVDTTELNLGSLGTSGYDYIFPNILDIDVSTTINFDDSYCCVAINDVTIIQHTGKEAIVKDKNGNTIFDGTGRGEGVYHLKCSFVPLHDFSITLTNGTVRNIPDYYVRNIYTGSNEKWTVTKEILVQ